MRSYAAYRASDPSPILSCAAIIRTLSHTISPSVSPTLRYGGIAPVIAQHHSRRVWQGRIALGSILAMIVAAMILRRSRTARRQPPSADSAGGLPASPGRAIGSRRRGGAPRRKAIAQNITILYRALGRAMCGPRRKACNWPAHRVGGPIIQNTCFA